MYQVISPKGVVVMTDTKDECEAEARRINETPDDKWSGFRVVEADDAE